MEDLRKYTKEDLIWLIKQIASHDLGGCGVGIALADLHYKKRKEILNKMDECSKKSSACLERYLDACKAYNGRIIAEIPQKVMKEMREALAEREAAEKEYDRLQKEYDRIG